jgi:hypothetical protein
VIRLPHKLLWTALAIALLAGTGFCEDAGRGGEDERLVLGEEDLAERGEMARNMFRRITPGNKPLVQDVGTWPVAWGEFAPNWDFAAAEREYGAWVVPFSLVQESGATVIRDANNTVLWRGETDFAKPESASVTLLGGLVAEEDWAAYEGVRDWVETNASQDMPSPGAMPPRTTTNGLRFTEWETTTNGDWNLGLAWEQDGEADVFAYSVPYDPEWRVSTWTNDENQVVTTTNLVWHSAGANLEGLESGWEWRGTAIVSNGAGLFVDSGVPGYLSQLRFYAAAEANDTDGDGWNDGWERFVWHTDPDVPDSVFPNPSGTEPESNVFWIVKTTNEWVGYGYEYLGNLPSWPDYPVHKTDLLVTGVPPFPDATPAGVALWGLVDDAITVDGNQVAWTNGAKVFEDFDVTESVTNLESGTFQIDLYDWPDLPDGGNNEVRLGRSDYPFRVVWTWAVPMEFRLEHIATNGAPLVVNPSGTRTNREITCLATVLPTNIPDSDIHWEVSGAGMTFSGGTNWGREVHLTATRTEDWVAIATVSNSTLRPARLRGTVLEKKDVNVYLHIVCDDGGYNPAMTVSHFDELLAEANRIWEQAAIEFHRPSSVAYTNRSDWQIIPTNDDWVTHDALQSWSSNTCGVEVYCIRQFANSDQPGLSCTNADATAGLTIISSASPRTLAHELGHACGLNDIYTNVLVNNVEVNLYDGALSRGHAQEDWCVEVRNGGYGNLTVHPMVCRLLMYGKDSPALASAVDIPTGRVLGLRANGARTSVRVGLGDMGNRDPRHW